MRQTEKDHGENFPMSTNKPADPLNQRGKCLCRGHRLVRHPVHRPVPQVTLRLQRRGCLLVAAGQCLRLLAGDG